VPPADPGALADGLRRVLTDAEFAAGLAQAARAWSRVHLSAGAMVDHHIRIYHELLEARCAE
jgi:glycosyltransferase involved in cell wall biosynthesis